MNILVSLEDSQRDFGIRICTSTSIMAYSRCCGDAVLCDDPPGLWRCCSCRRAYHRSEHEPWSFSSILRIEDKSPTEIARWVGIWVGIDPHLLEVSL